MADKTKKSTSKKKVDEGKTTSTYTSLYGTPQLNLTKEESRRALNPTAEEVKEDYLRHLYTKGSGKAEYVPVESLLLPANLPIKAASKLGKAAVNVAEAINPVSGLRGNPKKLASSTANANKTSSKKFDFKTLQEFKNLDYEKRLEFINTVDETIKQKGDKIIKDLQSAEGKKRLINQFKEADPNLSTEELENLYKTRVTNVERTLKGNRAKWVKDTKNLKASPEEAEKYIMSLNMTDYFPYDNAHYSNQSLYKYKDPSIASASSTTTKSSPSDQIFKTNKFLEPDPTPGYITLGKGYETSGPTVSHEAGHAIQKGNKMPIDDELRNLIDSFGYAKGNQFKGFIDDIWREVFSGSKDWKRLYNNLGYFLEGSAGKEPYPFAREARDLMVENKILNDTYDLITPENLTKAKKQLSGINADNRIFYLIPPWDRAKLAATMNKAPGLVPYLGAGYLGYEGLAESENPDSEQKAQGGYLDTNKGKEFSEDRTKRGYYYYLGESNKSKLLDDIALEKSRRTPYKKGGKLEDKKEEPEKKETTIVRDFMGDTYYSPVEDTVYLSAVGDEFREIPHEMYHAQQAKSGRLRSSYYDPYGKPRRKPSIAEEQAFVDYPYYNRTLEEKKAYMNEFLRQNPSFQFVNLDNVYRDILNPRIYSNPETAEGEATLAEFPEGRAYLESMGIGVQERANGGWLDNYADGGKVKKEDNNKAWNPNLGKKDKEFLEWYKNNTLEGKHGIPFNSKESVYDFYSYYKNTPKFELSNPNAHFPDTYKYPNHPTFSNESIYSTPEKPGGKWDGETYIKKGKFIYKNGGYMFANGGNLKLINSLQEVIEDPYLKYYNTPIPKSLAESPAWRAYTYAKGPSYSPVNHTEFVGSGDDIRTETKIAPYTKFDEVTGFNYVVDPKTGQPFDAIDMEGDKRLNLQRFLINPYTGQQQTKDLGYKKDMTWENPFPQSTDINEQKGNIFKDLYTQNLYKQKGDRTKAYSETKKFMKDRVEPLFEGSWYEFMNNPNVSDTEKSRLDTYRTSMSANNPDNIKQNLIAEMISPHINKILEKYNNNYDDPNARKEYQNKLKELENSKEYKDKLSQYSGLLEDYYVRHKGLSKEEAKEKTKGFFTKDTKDKNQNNVFRTVDKRNEYYWRQKSPSTTIPITKEEYDKSLQKSKGGWLNKYM